MRARPDQLAAGTDLPAHYIQRIANIDRAPYGRSTTNPFDGRVTTPRTELPRSIETERLLLRPYESSDVEDVFSYAADDEWGRYLPVPSPYLREHAETFLARQMLLDRSVSPTWAIVSDGSVVGGVDINFRFEHRVASIGYAVSRPLWGQGVATEAAFATVRAAFCTHADLNRIEATADVRNVGSQRVLEKIGMTREGVIRENVIIRGEVTTEVWFGLLRSEWKG